MWEARSLSFDRLCLQSNRARVFLKLCPYASFFFKLCSFSQKNVEIMLLLLKVNGKHIYPIYI